MKITIYGILLVTYVLYICLMKKSYKKIFIELLSLSIFLYLNITIGYIFKVGEQTIAGYFFTMLCMGVVAILCIRKMPKKRFIVMSIFLLNIFLSLILIQFMDYQVLDIGWDEYLFGYNKMVTCTIDWTHIKELIKTVFFVFAIEVIHQELEDSDWKYIISKVAKWSKVVLCYGLLEFFVVYFLKIHNLYALFLEPIFGLKKYTYTSALSRGNGYQLQGLFTEPSGYATGLFLIMLLLITQIHESKNRKKEICNFIWIAICLFLMIMSMSFSSVLYITLFIVLSMIYIYQTRRRYRTVILFSCFIITMIGVCSIAILLDSESYYGIRLNGALQIFRTAIYDSDMSNLYFHLRGTHADGSSIARIGSAIGSIKIEFVQNPISGLGVGTENSYAEFSNMLTDLGVIGTICWMKMVVFYQKKRNRYVYLALIAITISAFFSTPFFYLGADAIILAYMIETLYGNQNLKQEKVKDV